VEQVVKLASNALSNPSIDDTAKKHFVSSAVELLQVCAKPLLIEKSSDGIKNKNSIISFARTIGNLAIVRDNTYSVQVPLYAAKVSRYLTYLLFISLQII
jgi:hypothetical protein